VPLAAPPTPVSRTTGAPDLAGSVLLDGAPPHEVIHLDLVLDGAESRQLVTDDGGRFAVFAIGEGVSVSLSAPGYVVDDEASSSWWPLQVFTPRDDVVLRLLTPPAIRGRVVTARGEPVPRAHGSYALTATAGGWELIPGRGELDCDEEGRFALPLLDVMATGDPKLGEGEACSGSLLFEVPRVGRRLLETGPFPPRDLALGDVVLEAVRTLRFVVRDERGAALAGAVARLDDHWLAKPSSPTNREGRSELRTMLERTATVRFSALGYADRVLVLEPGDAADVWLEPVTLLEVQLEPPANTYGAFPLVVLVAHDPLFAWTDAPHPESGIDIDPIQTELGASMSYSHGYTKGPEGYFETTHWQPDAGGHALIVGIRPGLSFRLEARNEAGTVLATRELMLSPGERRRLTLPFGEPP
jgi:hypothetical protein